MSIEKRQSERLIVLVLIGILAFNFPFMSLFNREVFWQGIPVLYFYLFAVWALFIGCMAFIMRR